MAIDYRDLDLIVDITEWLETQGFKFQERSEELIADSCINCGRSKKMYIEKKSGLFKCHRCEYKGNALSLVMKVGGVSFSKAVEICYGIKKERINPDEIDDDMWEKDFQDQAKKSQKNDEPDPPIQVPKYFTKLTKGDSLAWEYLKNRGLTDEIIESLGLYYWNDGQRVVFTIETDQMIMGYMARDITGSQDPKTLNSRGNFRSFNFWNYDRVKDREDIIICEGIFSAIKAGPDRSIALLGKVATKGQISLLRTTKAKKIIFGLDVGTEEDQDKLYERLSVYYPGKIFKIEFPALIKFKEELNQAILDEINNKYKTSMRINPLTDISRFAGNKSVLYISPKDKKVIKDLLEGKKLILVSPPALEFMKVLKKADYLDAGDYTFEEMEDLLSRAIPYKKSQK